MALSFPNGHISYSESALLSGRYPLDTVASFTCNYGYSISGLQLQTCQPNEAWDNQPPTCTQSKKFNISFLLQQTIYCLIPLLNDK